MGLARALRKRHLDRRLERSGEIDRDRDRVAFHRAASGFADRHRIEHRTGGASREIGRLGCGPDFDLVSRDARGRGQRLKAEMLRGLDPVGGG